MPVTAVVLRELHRLLQQLSDLRSRLQRGPRQIQVADMHVQTAEQKLESSRELVKRTKMNADQKELQLCEREGRIVDIRAKLNRCSTNREYQTFLEQIAADEQANSVLSDEILEMLDKINDLQGTVETFQGQKATLEQEQTAVRQRVEKSQALLEAEVERLSADLTAAEAQLPSDFLIDYRRLVKARDERALAPLDGECCGGCYQTLTPQTVNELMLSKPIFCKACGCIIYMPENT